MKTLLLIPVLACLALAAAAQTAAQPPKTVVNCYESNGHVDYGHLVQLLPDSVTATLLVDVHKKLNTYDETLVLLWLEQQGWKLSAVDSKGAVSSYILSKEINLDDSARSLFLQKLENLHKK
jgi:hypothetical protein